jgi:hypothetical protein
MGRASHHPDLGASTPFHVQRHGELYITAKSSVFGAYRGTAARVAGSHVGSHGDNLWACEKPELRGEDKMVVGVLGGWERGGVWRGGGFRGCYGTDEVCQAVVPVCFLLKRNRSNDVFESLMSKTTFTNAGHWQSAKMARILREKRLRKTSHFIILFVQRWLKRILCYRKCERGNYFFKNKLEMSLL